MGECARTFHNEGIWRVIKAKTDPIHGRVILTEALEIPLAGCLLHVTTEHFNHDGLIDRMVDMIFVPGVCIKVAEEWTGDPVYLLAKL